MAVGNNISRQVIDEAKPYWYEEYPATLLFSSIPAASQVNLWTALQGWNGSGPAEVYVEVKSIGITQLQGLTVSIAADSKQHYYDAGEFPPGLEPLSIGIGGIKTFSGTLTNTTTSAMINVQANVTFRIWKMPVSFKVMKGYALSPQEKASAAAVRETLSTTTQGGTKPMTIDTIIRGTYLNRNIGDPPLYVGRFTATSQPQTVDIDEAGTNQALLITRFASEANIEDGVALFLTRDGQSDHITLRADNLDLHRGIDCLAMVTRQYTFQASASANPSAAIPLRVEGIRMSLSNILRARLGVTAKDFQQVYGSAATEFVARVQTGVY